MIKHNRIILEKIIDEAEVVSQLINGFAEFDFIASEATKRAVCMTLINIGELVKNLKDDLRQNYSNIPWKQIAGFRDVASHGYFTLRLPEVWVYASQEVPLLKVQIEEILENEGKTDKADNP